jgi:hypothetical protein
VEGGFLRIAVLPTALLWLMQAHAAMNAYACNDCTQAQYREKAASVVAEYGTTLRPYAYIYDKTRGVLRKYSVSPKAVAGGYQYVLDDIAPTASESDIWNEIREAIAANGGKSIFRVELDAAAAVFPILRGPALSGTISATGSRPAPMPRLSHRLT